MERGIWFTWHGNGTIIITLRFQLKPSWKVGAKEGHPCSWIPNHPKWDLGGEPVESIFNFQMGSEFSPVASGVCCVNRITTFKASFTWQCGSSPRGVGSENYEQPVQLCCSFSSFCFLLNWTPSAFVWQLRVLCDRCTLEMEKICLSNSQCKEEAILMHWLIVRKALWKSYKGEISYWERL